MKLFVDSKDKTRFLTVTGKCYDNMQARLAKRKTSIAIPFTKDRLRQKFYAALREDYGGIIQCRYCARPCGIEEVNADHAVPLAQGGSAGIENIEFPCAACNAQKGEMRPEEFEALLAFLRSPCIVFSGPGILKRLQEHSKLLAGKRRAEMLIRNNGNPPPKKKRKPGMPPLAQAMEDSF